MNKLLQEIKHHPLMNQPRQLSYSIRSLAGREPALWPLYHLYFWWDQITWNGVIVHPKEKAIRQDTELVIDGFPGSANSFAFKSFNRSQTRPVKVGHHSHAPAQIIKAIKQGIPVLLTVRAPAGAVVSLTSRWSYISVTQALQIYIGFYTKMRPYASQCVISTFEQTTQHLDQIVQNVNSKFGTHFDVVDVPKANVEHKAFKAKLDKSKSQKAARHEALKQEKIKELTAAKNAQLLVKANALYQTFEALAQNSSSSTVPYQTLQETEEYKTKP